LGRAGVSATRRRRPIRLPARSFSSARCICLWLGVVARDPNRRDGGGGGYVFAILRSVNESADQLSGNGGDRFGDTHDRQLSRCSCRWNCAERVDGPEDRRSGGACFLWTLSRELGCV